jgi:hypothetical protein
MTSTAAGLSSNSLWPRSYGLAKRLRFDVECVPQSILIGQHGVAVMTASCDQCAARFAIVHPVGEQNPGLAQKQAAWLRERFTWDHIQQRKHAGSVPLPGPAGL